MTESKGVPIHNQLNLNEWTSVSTSLPKTEGWYDVLIVDSSGVNDYHKSADKFYPDGFLTNEPEFKFNSNVIFWRKSND